MKLRNILFASLAAALSIGLASCGDKSGEDNPGGGGDKPVPPPVEVEPAQGAYSYVGSSMEERTEILGVLEKYAVDNHLTGITLYEDGSYSMYSPTVKKGTNNYIPGYGYGALTEGEITADLSGETNQAWKRYYHDYLPEDPKTINYMDDKGSVVGGITGYSSSGFWDTRMNETKDGYEWYSLLAKEKPQPLNLENGVATRYRFAVKTGKDGFKYSTLTQNQTLKKYNNREVQLQDYETAFQMLHTQAFGMARGAEQLSGQGSIKGMQQYYNSSKNGINEVAWDNVGIKTYEEGGKEYFEVEFNLPTTPFYAMYYLASTLYSPIPLDFVKDLGTLQGKTNDVAQGMKAYGKSANTSSDKLNPVDTFLSTGPYTIERWDTDQQVVWKKNSNYAAVGGTKRYKIDGVHIRIMKSMQTNPNAAFDEFINKNSLSAVGIPSKKLSEYKNDPRTVQNMGNYTTKMNLNTTTTDEWNYLFGENGTITQTASSEKWDLKPAMSNDNFLDGLSYAINRVEFAENQGYTPSANYLGSGYQSDPENGIMYNSTEAHKKAVASSLAGTDGYGYSKEKAIESFSKAANELLASGAYEEGDEVVIEVAWFNQAQHDNYGKLVEQYWLNTFNDPRVCDNKLTLKITNWFATANTTDIYYKKMMVGQFDIAYGGIQGNTLNPLNFMEILKSDNSSGFTLNWGPNTNVVSDSIVYDGKSWSFDALWQASETGGYFEDGLYVNPYEISFKSQELNSDGSLTVQYNLTLKEAEGLSIAFNKANIFGFMDEEGQQYSKDQITDATYDSSSKVLTLKIPKNLVDKYKACKKVIGVDPDGKNTTVGIDIYFDLDVLGIKSSPYTSQYISLK